MIILLNFGILIICEKQQKFKSRVDDVPVLSLRFYCPMCVSAPTNAPVITTKGIIS